VLLLDCDVVAMRDPSYMFDAPEFRQAGNYFWGDIYGTWTQLTFDCGDFQSSCQA
jgi:hypothetical protein